MYVFVTGENPLSSRGQQNNLKGKEQMDSQRRQMTIGMAAYEGADRSPLSIKQIDLVPTTHNVLIFLLSLSGNKYIYFVF